MRRALVVALLGACSSPTGPEPGAQQPVAPAVMAPAPLTTAIAPDAAPSPAPLSPPPPPRVTLAFTGDVMFGGFFAGPYVPLRVDVHDPLAEVAPLLVSDLTIANLETALLREIPRSAAGPKTFVAAPEHAAVLARAGIDVVTLANNHAYDMGVAGVTETPTILAEVGVGVVGAARASEPAVRTETLLASGVRVAVIAATAVRNRSARAGEPLLPYVRPEALATTLVPLVTAATADHAVVVVVLHWGSEYTPAPSRWQVEAAHALVDAGALAVIGHHAHVLQGIERYGRGVIAYSLGNFLFRNGRSLVRPAGVLRLGVTGTGKGACLDEVTLLPVVQLRQPIYHPIPATGRELEEVGDRLVPLSLAAPLRTTWTTLDERFVTDGSCPAS